MTSTGHLLLALRESKSLKAIGATSQVPAKPSPLSPEEQRGSAQSAPTEGNDLGGDRSLRAVSLPALEKKQISSLQSEVRI